MRPVVVLCCVALAATGCEAGKFGRYSEVGGGCAPAGCGPTGCAAPAAPTPAAPAPNYLPPVRDAKIPGVREVHAPDDAGDPRASAINPDILLIPRTVLVPYAPHVPSGPVRLAGSTTVSQVVQTDGRVVAPQLTDALEQCLQQMKLLNARIAELEAKTAAPPTVVVTPDGLPLAPPRIVPPTAGPGPTVQLIPAGVAY